MRALSFIDFCLNEGASIEGNDGQVTLNYSNNAGNYKEVLKTTSKGQHVKYYPKDDISDNQKFEVRWGLDYDTFRGVVDHEGRFKYTMDQLKNANIINKDSALRDFLESSYKDLGIEKFKPDYIVAVGSTAGLVANLVNITHQLFPKSERFNLPKIEYANVGAAIDWDELYRQKGGKHAYRFLSELLNKHAKNTKELRYALKEIDSFGELKEFFENELPNIEWRDEDNDGKSLIPFKVRSSGVWSRDGFRDFLKPKYDTVSAEFQDMILECISEGKRMLIMDDNRNTDTDIKTLCSDIDKIAEMLGEDPTSGYRSNFKFYLLYSMAEKDINQSFSYKIKDGNIEHHEIRKDATAATSFINFLRTGDAGEGYKTADKIKQEKDLKIANLVQQVVDVYKFFYPKIQNQKLTMDKAIKTIANKNNQDFEKVKRSYYKALKTKKQHNVKEYWPYDEKYQ